MSDYQTWSEKWMDIMANGSKPSELAMSEKSLDEILHSDVLNPAGQAPQAIAYPHSVVGSLEFHEYQVSVDEAQVAWEKLTGQFAALPQAKPKFELDQNNMNTGLVKLPKKLAEPIPDVISGQWLTMADPQWKNVKVGYANSAVRMGEGGSGVTSLANWLTFHGKLETWPNEVNLRLAEAGVFAPNGDIEWSMIAFAYPRRVSSSGQINAAIGRGWLVVHLPAIVCTKINSYHLVTGYRVASDDFLVFNPKTGLEAPFSIPPDTRAVLIQLEYHRE